MAAAVIIREVLAVATVGKREAVSSIKREDKKRECTEQVAQELYKARLRLGREGNPLTDWLMAEKIVHSPLKKTLFASNRYLQRFKETLIRSSNFFVFDIPRWFIFSAPKLEWIKLLAVPLVLAAAGSIITSQIQREANQNAALKEYFDQLDTLVFDQGLLSDNPSDGAIVLTRGRTVAALRELDHPRRQQLISFLLASGLARVDGDAESIASFRDQNLSGIDFGEMDLTKIDFQEASLREANLKESFLDEANLQGVNLRNANLEWARLFQANLKGANLNGANLKSSTLNGANLEGSFLSAANLEGAQLGGTNFKGARFYYATLRGAYLSGASLEGAFMIGVNLKGAYLFQANLKGASLRWADLGGANLEQAELQGANLNEANLEGVFRLTQEQLQKAKLCQTILPRYISVDGDRDCEEMRNNVL